MRRFLSFCVAAVIAAPAFAGSTIDPVVVDLKAGRGSVAITNVTNSATGYDIRALDWSIDETGEDVLEATDNLLVFPPLFRLAPGQTITLRLREAVPPTQSENAYRLEITEEPPQVAGSGVGIQMRYLTSVFSSAEEWTPSISCRKRDGGMVRVENRGQKRTRIEAVLANGTDVSAEADMSGRVLLAGEARVVILPEERAASAIQLGLDRQGRVTCE